MTPDAGKKSGTDEAVREEAIAWLGRLRGPDGAEYHTAFEDWYTSSPHNAEIYDDVLGNWERMALARRTPTGEASRRQAATSGAPRWPRIAVAAAAAMILVVLSGVGLHRFSGTFTARDPFGLARMAAAMFDLSLSRDDQGNILLGRPSAASK